MPNPYLYTASTAGRSIYRWDTIAHTFTTITTPQNFQIIGHGVSVSGDQTKYAAVQYQGQVGSVETSLWTLFNVADDSVVNSGSFNAYKNNSATALSPDGSVLYVKNTHTSSPSNPFITAINTTNGTVLWNAALSTTVSTPNRMEITPDGTQIYFSAQFVLNTSTQTITTLTGVPTATGNPAMAPNGAYVYFYSNGLSTVYKVSTTTNAVVATCTGITNPTAMTVSADSNSVFVVTGTLNGTKSFVSINASTMAVTTSVNFTSNGNNAVSARTSPLGDNAFCLLDTTSQIATLAIGANTVSILPGSSINGSSFTVSAIQGVNAPPPPTGFAPIGTSTNAYGAGCYNLLQWNTAAGTTWNLQRATDLAFTMNVVTLATGLTGTTYGDPMTTANDGITYYYRLIAVAGGVQSVPSPVVSIVASCPACACAGFAVDAGVCTNFQPTCC